MTRRNLNRAKNYVRHAPDADGMKAKLEKLLSRHMSAAFTAGSRAAHAAIEAEIEALIDELDNLPQPTPAQI